MRSFTAKEERRSHLTCSLPSPDTETHITRTPKLPNTFVQYKLAWMSPEDEDAAESLQVDLRACLYNFKDCDTIQSRHTVRWRKETNEHTTTNEGYDPL